MNRSLEHARLLLQKARDDAYLLAACLDDSKMPGWILGFHAQQAVEKTLKAVLTNSGFEYPRTHDLSLLLSLLADNGLPAPPDAEQIRRLTPFGVFSRYDDEVDIGPEPALDRKMASRAVNRILEWADRTLRKTTDAGS